MIHLLFNISLHEVDPVGSNDGPHIGQLQLTASRAVDYIYFELVSIVIEHEHDDHAVCSDEPVVLFVVQVANQHFFYIGPDALQGQRLVLEGFVTRKDTHRVRAACIDDVQS